MMYAGHCLVGDLLISCQIHIHESGCGIGIINPAEKEGRRHSSQVRIKNSIWFPKIVCVMIVALAYAGMC